MQKILVPQREEPAEHTGPHYPDQVLPELQSQAGIQGEEVAAMARNPARNPVRPRNPRSAGLSPGERFSIIGFFGEVWGELRRVTWPTREEATRLTVLVLIVSTAFGLFLGGADLLFSEVMSLLAGT